MLHDNSCCDVDILIWSCYIVPNIFTLKTFSLFHLFSTYSIPFIGICKSVQCSLWATILTSYEKQVNVLTSASASRLRSLRLVSWTKSLERLTSSELEFNPISSSLQVKGENKFDYWLSLPTPGYRVTKWQGLILQWPAWPWNIFTPDYAFLALELIPIVFSLFRHLANITWWLGKDRHDWNTIYPRTTYASGKKDTNLAIPKWNQ